MAETIEGPLLTVPYEALRRSAKDKKSSMDEINSIIKMLDAQNASTATVAQQQQLLDTMLSKLHHLKQQLDENNKAEEADAFRCQARLQHLQQAGLPPKDGVISWNRHRLDRLLVDHMLHCGFYQTATCLTNKSHMENFVELHIFSGAQNVVQHLRDHDCSAALAWCEYNRARVKKHRNRLEFKLRLQEFVELVRQGQMLQAIKYARGHLAPWANVYLQELQHAMAILAFKADTQCSAYKDLFAESQWKLLEELFYQELYRLNNLTSQSLLAIHLQAGLSALKPPDLISLSRRDDPLGLAQFQKLAEGLPYSKHEHSRLICPVTLDVMNEHNPPMVASNGAVYSEKAVQQIAAQNQGMFKNPQTGEACEVSELKRAFIS